MTATATAYRFRVGDRVVVTDPPLDVQEQARIRGYYRPGELGAFRRGRGYVAMVFPAHTNPDYPVPGYQVAFDEPIMELADYGWIVDYLSFSEEALRPEQPIIITHCIHTQEETTMATSTKKTTTGTTNEPNLTRMEIRYVPEDRVAEIFMKASLGREDGFLPTDELELVDVPAMQWQHCPPTHPNNLDKVYSEYQRVDSALTERVEQLGVRSMSVGDCVVIGDKQYWVASEGFVTKDDSGNIVPVTA